MRYQAFSTQTFSQYEIAILSGTLDELEMSKEYLQAGNLNPDSVIAYDLVVTGKKGTKVAVQKEYLDELVPTLDELNVTYILVTNSDYFKTLTGTNKAELYLGYVLPNKYPADLEGKFNVIYCPNYRQIYYNPGPTRAKIKQALDALMDHKFGCYIEPGKHVLKRAEYPQTVSEIKFWLGRLLEMDCDLTCDIETFSLKFYDAGIGTIAFSWNQHEGVCFPVDFLEESQEVRRLLRIFFKNFNHTMSYHNASFDVSVLIYQLFMTDILDTKGLLYGMDVMLSNYDCTRLISYLATNTCAGNKLSLKDQAQEFAGNYAVEEIKDIRSVPMPALLEYNLVDACSTWYVKNKNYPKMVHDQQLEIYEELFKPAQIDIIQMQLTGMPLCMKQVKRSKKQFKSDLDNALARIQSHPIVQGFVSDMNDALENERYQKWVERKNNGVKVRGYVSGNFNETFNPNSPDQMQKLFYDVLNLPILERTDTKQPATGSTVMEMLKAYTEDQDIVSLIDAILDFKAVDKIYGTFIPAMEKAVKAKDGRHYLFGNFNLGGTVSGRLSSSGPNLQTIPANGATPLKRQYAKLIKKCFQAPDGWLMIGLDFDSLEDRISALTTKDPNKLKVYEDGFDGHCLRAHSYFEEDMPDIDPTSVDSINSVAEKYKVLRQESKVPTFLLTYGGTWIGMMAKCGFSKEKAQKIEARYHELYKAADKWVSDKLDEASRVGYIIAAFGLRVRTPLLHQVIRGNRSTPYEAEAEGRTAGNALGQSWCLLNNRASIEFMRKVRASEYKYKIRPIAHIHDSQYYLIPEDIDVFRYVNEHLVKAVSWQDHPDIAHPVVKLSGKLAIYYPDWTNEITVPNNATREEVIEICQKNLNQAA